ncbi:MAG: hypothetical protein JNL43_16775 [Flavobacteriales bacterium]|nr:hypothetical protein [Flavobacteriales bacterium]
MRTSRYLLLAVVVLLVTACEKYPDDIPPWVREKIKYCAKEKNDCRGLTIDEYSYNGAVYYILETRAVAFSDEELFDFHGNLICTGDINTWGDDTCGTVPEGQLVHLRDLWTEY